MRKITDRTAASDYRKNGLSAVELERSSLRNVLSSLTSLERTAWASRGPQRTRHMPTANLQSIAPSRITSNVNVIVHYCEPI